MSERISISIETSCRAGGVALGRGETWIATHSLGPSGRHGADLLPQLDALLQGQGLQPADVDEVYFSAGPGSFTGLRVGITVARTLGQMIPALRLVAVPTALAVAENLSPADGEHIGVLLAAKENTAHATLLKCDGGATTQVAPPRLARPEELWADWPRPLTMTGEALEFLVADWPGDIALAQEALWLPTAEGVWRVGRRLAETGKFTPWQELLPIYAHRPEAIRLWERKQREKTG